MDADYKADDVASPAAAWRDQNEQVLAEKRRAEEAAKQQRVADGRAALQQFASEKEVTREAKRQSNRTSEAAYLEQLEAALTSDNPWARVVSLVDIRTGDNSSATGDVSRMRTVLVGLKSSPLQVISA